MIPNPSESFHLTAGLTCNESIPFEVGLSSRGQEHICLIEKQDASPSFR